MAQPSHKASSSSLLADDATPYSISVTLPGTPADFDIIILGLFSGSASSTFAVSGGGATYASIGKVTGSYLQAEWFWARLQTGNTAPTATSTGSDFFVYCTMYTGCVQTGTPYKHATLSNNTSSTTVSSSNITPNIADTRIIALASIEDNNTISDYPPSGWTGRCNIQSSTGDDGSGLIIEYDSNPACGVQVDAVTICTQNAADYYVSLTLALVPQYITGPDGSAGKVYLSQPLGDNLLTNGDFSDGSTGWSLASGSASVSGGVLVLNTANNYSSIVDRSSAVGIQLNHTYLIEFDIVSRTSGSIKFGLGNTSNGVYSIEYNSIGHKAFYLTQTNASAPDDIVIYTWSSGANLTMDNFSIREVL